MVMTKIDAAKHFIECFNYEPVSKLLGLGEFDIFTIDPKECIMGQTPVNVKSVNGAFEFSGDKYIDFNLDYMIDYTDYLMSTIGSTNDPARLMLLQAQAELTYMHEMFHLHQTTSMKLHKKDVTSEDDTAYTLTPEFIFKMEQGALDFCKKRYSEFTGINDVKLAKIISDLDYFSAKHTLINDFSGCSLFKSITNEQLNEILHKTNNRAIDKICELRDYVREHYPNPPAEDFITLIPKKGGPFEAFKKSKKS